MPGFAATFLTGAIETPVPSAVVTAAGNSTAQTGYGPAQTLRCQLNVSAASGTAPTLDVVVEDTIDGTTWNTVGTFVQATAVTRSVINITTPFSEQLRVRWTTGGTTPSFTFAVTWVAMA